MKTKNILILGINGLIGAYLAQACLDKGYTVIGVCRQSSELKLLHKLNIFERCSLIKIKHLTDLEQYINTHDRKYDFVVNCITARNANKHDLKHVNADFPLKVAQLINHRNLKCFIHFGSSQEYGHATSPICEDAVENPTTPHGSSKLLGNNTLKQYAKKNNIPLVILRPFYVFGAFEKSSRIIPQTIEKLKADQPISIISKEFKRDFIYIKDVTSAVMNILKSPPKSVEVFNIGSGTSITIQSIVETLAKEIKVSARYCDKNYTPREWDMQTFHASMEKMLSYYNWHPTFSLKAAVSDYLVQLKESDNCA